MLQYTDSNLAIQVRTEGGVEGIGTAILQQIRSLDLEVAPIYAIPLSTVVSARAFYMPRVIATLSGILALTALPLWGAIDATIRRQDDWTGAGRSRTFWVSLQGIGAPFGVVIIPPNRFSPTPKIR